MLRSSGLEQVLGSYVAKRVLALCLVQLGLRNPRKKERKKEMVSGRGRSGRGVGAGAWKGIWSRPSSALSPCGFATCMRALIPSPVPACLRSLPRPSLALSPSEFESLYMRALTPTPVPAGLGARQAHGRQPRSRCAPQESDQSSYGSLLFFFDFF